MRQDAIRYRVLPRISPSHGVKEDKLYKCSDGENFYASLGHKSRHIGQRQQFSLCVNLELTHCVSGIVPSRPAGIGSRSHLAIFPK